LRRALNKRQYEIVVGPNQSFTHTHTQCTNIMRIGISRRRKRDVGTDQIGAYDR